VKQSTTKYEPHEPCEPGGRRPARPSAEPIAMHAQCTTRIFWAVSLSSASAASVTSGHKPTLLSWARKCRKASIASSHTDPSARAITYDVHARSKQPKCISPCAVPRLAAPAVLTASKRRPPSVPPCPKSPLVVHAEQPASCTACRTDHLIGDRLITLWHSSTSASRVAELGRAASASAAACAYSSARR